MITTLSSKVSSRASFGLKDYPKKAYMDRINPQFIDLSRKNIEQKKQTKKMRSWKTQMAHQLSTIQKINQRYQKKIQKQRADLSYMKTVKNRAQQDRIQKQKLNILKTKELNKRRMDSFEARTLSRERSEISQLQYSYIKNSIANSVKRENRYLYEEKQHKDTNRMFHNQSLVSKIENDKHKGRQSVNKFHRRQNSQSVSRLSRSIDQQRKSIKKDQIDIQRYENKCKEQKQKKQYLAMELDKLKMQIQLLQNERTSIGSHDGGSKMSRSVPSSASKSRFSLNGKNQNNGYLLKILTPKRQNNISVNYKKKIPYGGGLYQYNV